MMYAYVNDFNGNTFQADYQLETLEEKICRYAELGFKSLSIGYEESDVHGEIVLNSEVGKQLYKIHIDFTQEKTVRGKSTLKKQFVEFFAYADSEASALKLANRHASPYNDCTVSIEEATAVTKSYMLCCAIS